MKTAKTQIEALKLNRDILSRELDAMVFNDLETDPEIESLMDSMHCNPLGRLLEVISLLPEVRVEKVEHARRQIQQDDLCSDTRMDIALDRVLEEIVADD